MRTEGNKNAFDDILLKILAFDNLFNNRIRSPRLQTWTATYKSVMLLKQLYEDCVKAILGCNVLIMNELLEMKEIMGVVNMLKINALIFFGLTGLTP